MKVHVVTQGECLSSIAFENGFFWKTLWDHPGNAGLRAERGDPYVLLPGDRVEVPDVRPREVEVGTGQRHSFRRKGVPEKLRVQILDAGTPRASAAYELEVDGVVSRGTTDAEGVVERYLAPNARRGRLRVAAGGQAPAREYELVFRALDPVSEPSGVRARLRSLGFLLDGPAGETEDALREAIAAFQRKNKIDATGEADGATRDALAGAYGC